MPTKPKTATANAREDILSPHAMSTISVQDIQRDPLTFLRRVEAGEAFVVVRGGRPLAEVRPLTAAATQPRPFGLAQPRTHGGRARAVVERHQLGRAAAPQAAGAKAGAA